MKSRGRSIILALFLLQSINDVMANNYFSNQNNRMMHQQRMGNTRQRIRPPQVNSVGFVGGPDGDVVVRSMYLLYRRFLAIMVFKQGRGQHFVQRNGQIELNDIPCIGGCPRDTSFCDKGICRCFKSLMALHGTCWKHHEGVIEDAANWELKKEQKIAVPQTKTCSSHRTCHEIDINLICRRDKRRCFCRETMRWNAEESECQVFVPLECPKIVNGTIVEEDEEENKETEEEEEKELEEVTNDVAMGGYNQQRRLDRNQMSSRFDRQMPRQGYNDVVRGSRHQLENGVKRRRFDSKEEEEEEEDAEENKPKPIMLLKIDPYSTNEFQVKEAFCHDMTILYRNFTSEDMGGHYFFAPFKSTPTIVAIFIVFSILIAGGCFYAFANTAKTEAFLKEKFKTPKRCDTPPEFHDVDDSDDDEKPITGPPAGNRGPPNKNVRLFSTPTHNPNNPFNAASEGTPRRP